MIPKIGSVICIFALISLLAIGSSWSEKEIPQTKLSQHGGPTMSFFYW